MFALIFRNPTQYWEYTSQYFSSREVGAQAGVCIDRGYIHVVSYEQDAFALQATLAHEFVHSLLRHRQLPRWLEEGLAESVPMQMGLPAGNLGKFRKMPRIQACWHKHGLKEFWSGTSFSPLTSANRHPTNCQRFCSDLFWTAPITSASMISWRPPTVVTAAKKRLQTSSATA